MSDYLIIGASAAGLSCAERLRELAPNASIAVVSEDPQVYSRCMLHKGLSGERNDAALDFVDPDFFQKNRIEWIRGTRVEQVNEFGKTVRLNNGTKLEYGKLLIASGAEAMLPPVANLRDAGNVYGFRDLKDLNRIRQALQTGAKQIVIIGAGLVGLDAAQGLCELGLSPTVICRGPRIMRLQADDFVAQLFQKRFEEHGCKFYISANAEKAELDDAGNVKAIVLRDETRIPCDAVIVAVGVRPNMDFLQGTSIQGMYMNYHIQNVLNRYLRKSSVHVERGLVVDKYLKTSALDIYAAGDVTGKSAIWPEAKAMGRCVASNMVGIPEEYPEPYPYQNTGNFWGLTMCSLGRLDIDENAYRVLVHYNGDDYKKLILRDGHLVGALMVGDLQNAGVYRHLMWHDILVDRFTEQELFTLSFADFYGVNPKTGAYQFQM